MSKQARRFRVHIRNLLVALFRDLNLDSRDKAYILRRFHNEGVYFVTRLLPQFSAYVLRLIEGESVLPPTSFERVGRFPLFMRGLLKSAISGSAQDLLKIRQVCDYFYKVAYPFTEAQLHDSKEKYKSADLNAGKSIDAETVAMGRKIFLSLFPRLCSRHLHDLFDQCRPHDGPGAFSRSDIIPRELGMRWYTYKRYPSNLIGSHPRGLNGYSGYFKSYPSSKERLKPVADYTIAEVRFVPKDARGPRTISKEPYFLLKAQLGSADALSRLLEHESLGRIMFSSQEQNQLLSKESSITKEWATLDLKDASDLVSYKLVSRLFQHIPLFHSLFKLRSTHVDLGGEIHPLRKFANMGNGLCFPILSLVTYLAAVTGIYRRTRMSLDKVRKLVHVFGDDLIVPSRYASFAIEGLTGFGLLVNTNKSFINGNFRESCGADYYHGRDVTPVRLRLSNGGLEDAKGSRKVLLLDPNTGVLQVERHCRELRKAGLFSLANEFYRQIEKHFALKLPEIGYQCPGLGRVVEKPLPIEVKTLVPVQVKVTVVDVCGWKGIGNYFRPRVNRFYEKTLGLEESISATPFWEVPVPRKYILRQRTLCPASVAGYGLT